MPGMANKTIHGVKNTPINAQLQKYILTLSVQYSIISSCGIREINVYGGDSPGAFRKVFAALYGFPRIYYFSKFILTYISAVVNKKQKIFLKSQGAYNHDVNPAFKTGDT